MNLLGGLGHLSGYSKLSLSAAQDKFWGYLKDVLGYAIALAPSDSEQKARQAIAAMYSNGVIVASNASGPGVYSLAEAQAQLQREMRSSSDFAKGYAAQALSRAYENGYSIVNTDIAKETAAPAADPRQADAEARYARLMSVAIAAKLPEMTTIRAAIDAGRYDSAASQLKTMERWVESKSKQALPPTAETPVKVRATTSTSASASTSTQTAQTGMQRQGQARRAAPWSAARVASFVVGAVLVITLAAWLATRRT